MDDAAALQARFQEALTLHQQGDLSRAQAIYRDILTQAPAQADVLFLLGIIAMQMQNFDEAATLLGRATAANPTNAEAWFNLGLALLNLQRHQAAIDSFDRVIQLQSNNPDAHNNRAIALRAIGRHAEALQGYDAALALQPQSPETLNNRGVTLADLERYEESAASCEQAIALKPDYAEAHNNLGIAKRMLQRHDQALASFERAVALNPTDAQAYNNRGLVWAEAKKYQAALTDYTKAIELNPRYAEAFNNRAISLVETRQYDAALANYRQAIALNPAYADAYVNIGHALSDLKRFEEAVTNYQTARRIKPDAAFLDGHLLYTRMMNCDWQGIESEIAEVKQCMGQGARATSPFPALALTDDAALQRRAIETWVRARSLAPGSGPPYRDAASGKIRVGYFSMDFREHPIAMLTAGLFETHDRAAFEIIAFSYGPDLQDDMQKRLQHGFDRFIDVRAMADAEIADLAHSLQLDIAVDLAGYTKNARAGIFALRPAPAQVSYLGFPGTLATPHIDYIIADHITIPPEARPHYTEKVVYLPHFQVNDDKRARPTQTFSREDLGLPVTGTVFCCFNNTYKLSPDVFSAWMRILKRTEGSVLFLYADTESAAANLRREAAARGVAAERLIFGKRLDMTGYLARYKAADLFLDTLPYNAGTTAADALWMDLPVLTCTGGAFASRMAASLLHALDLPELITADLDAYENRAVALAEDPALMATIKQKLARNRLTSPLFNTAAFTRTLEAAYRQMCERTRGGQPPDHIFVS